MSRYSKIRHLILLASMPALIASAPPKPDSAKNPASHLMLAGPGFPADTHQIDFELLPKLKSEHVVVSDVRAQEPSPRNSAKTAGGVNQHNYLTYHRDHLWVMWSDGPGVEDQVGQRVKYATSRDGLQWSVPKDLSGYPPGSGPRSPHYGTRSNLGKRYIARGFWERDSALLALVALDEAAGFFGPSLELRAFRFDPNSGEWNDAGLLAKNAINNFPPRKLRNGEWMMSRRRHDYKTTGVDFLTGGVKAIDDWRSFPVLESAAELKAEEPEWWELPDGRLCAIFRDNARSGYLFRSFSSDNGRTWSKPVRTNFPDATSKVCGLRLSDGRYVLVSNSNPKKRDPLTIAVSDDGLVFSKLFYLVGGRHVDYPHMIEHEGSLIISFSGGKQSVEMIRIRLSDLNSPHSY